MKKNKCIVVMSSDPDKSETTFPARVFVGAKAMERATLWMVEERHKDERSERNEPYSFWTEQADLDDA
jgi:succinate dehydrogenase/fumarate reductase-like Fe-S protein